MAIGSARAATVAGNGRRGAAPPPGQPLRTHHRRRGLVTAGVLLVVVCALLVAMLFSRAGGKVAVIVTARPVALGHVISRADLTTAQIATDSIPGFAGGHMSEVVGKTAAVGLVKGEIVSPAMLTDRPSAPVGSAVVGVHVKAGQLPAGGLLAGDTVMVVLLPAPASTSGAASVGTPTVLANSATVADAASLASGDGWVVSVQVPRTDAAALAAASSAELVALVKVPTS